jgi:hypothetical protein
MIQTSSSLSDVHALDFWDDLRSGFVSAIAWIEAKLPMLASAPCIQHVLFVRDSQDVIVATDDIVEP